MQTKIVYSIISDETDYYLEAVIFSVTSLRKYNHDAVVVLVTDTETDMNMRGRSKVSIDELFNQVKVVDIPVEYAVDRMIRSRYLKTNLRSYVDGDFLYIDADTVICGSLAGIDFFDAELASVDENIIPENKLATNRAKQVNLYNYLEKHPYRNSGVIFSRDTDLSREFFAEWHKNYLEYASGNYNLKTDQTTFNFSNIKLNFPIKALNYKYNYFLWRGGKRCCPPELLDEALILHYFNGNKYALRYIADKSIFKIIRKQGIDNSLINCILDYPRLLVFPGESRLWYRELDRLNDLYLKGGLFYNPVRALAKIMCFICAKKIKNA